MAYALPHGHCIDATTVRLFITSYSDDFFSEREVLRKEIQPALEAWCRNKSVSLEVYHMKWGGKHPDKRNATDLETVQTSIESCYYNNVMPLFLNFTSESLGWVPMWGDCPDAYIEEYLQTYGLLVEDLEVMYGAYREDNLNSLFLIRSDDFLDTVPVEEKSCFAQKTSVSEKIATNFGGKISQQFPKNRIIKYKPTYKGLNGKRRRPKLNFEDNLKEMILEFLKERISSEYLGKQTQRGNYQDRFTRQLHEIFMNTKSERIMGREDIVNKLEEYITKEDRDVPLILLGGAGCGKSSILCRAAAIINDKAQKGALPCSFGKNWHVFFHFVGAVPGSTTVEVMLKRLLREMEVANDSNMPKDLDATAQMCCSMLSNPNTKPLIMFVDALNQFAYDQAARVMSWLPRKLAPQVRCIFSSIDQAAQHETLLQRETRPIEVHITPLDIVSRKDIVQGLLKEYNRCLNEAQLEMLMQKKSSENPLWLAVACEEIRQLTDPEEVHLKIQTLQDGLLKRQDATAYMRSSEKGNAAKNVWTLVLFFSLLEQLLSRLGSQPGGHLVTATLCLLEASAAGLLESELREILGNEATLMPPSPFDEKEEKESSEKESNKQNKCLSEIRWQTVFSTLKAFLRPYGDSKEGRLDFYHRAVSKAVRSLYFKPDENGEKGHAYFWWHKKLADFFEHTENEGRLIEEYPYQLVCLDDKYHLAKCLCDWRVFDKLYHEEYSSQLLAHWRKVGPAHEMVSYYEKALSMFEEDESVKEELVSIRYEKVCRVVIQAGKYHEALELLKTAMKIEEKELGARAHRMVELYALMAEIYDEKLKLNDFVSPSQLPDLRKTITYGRKSIGLRKKQLGTYHKFKLGMSLMKLAFNMESWEACEGSGEMSGEEALTEGNKCIDKALKIFQELDDMGHYAEALMTKGVLAPRGSMEQLKLYNQAMDLCMQMYGEYHILTSRLYINIGIVYEDNKDYRKAYEFFKKWARVSEEILGPEHPKTLRAKGVLRETRYKRIAQELSEWDYDDLDDDLDDDDDDEEEEEVENLDLEHYYDDSLIHFTENNISALENSSAQLEETHQLSHDNRDDNDQLVEDDVGEIFMNGYYEEENTECSNEDSDHEHSDNENFFDDNFEDYDEHYTQLLDSSPVIEEFNAQLDYEDDDYDIVELAAVDCIEGDNRYAADSHDDDEDENSCEQEVSRVTWSRQNRLR